MAREAAIRIDWETASRIAPESAKQEVLTGEQGGAEAKAPEAPDAAPKADRPILVYVLDPTAPMDASNKVENVVLKDERIALGARAFRRVKMSPEDAAADPIVSKKGKEIPRFVVVSPDYKNAIAIEKASLSAGGLWDSLKTVAAKFYETSIETAVKKTTDVLIEYDKISGEKKQLEDKKKRLGEKAAAADIKEVEEKLAALEERQKKAQEREKAIWDLKPKEKV